MANGYFVAMSRLVHTMAASRIRSHPIALRSGGSCLDVSETAGALMTLVGPCKRILRATHLRGTYIFYGHQISETTSWVIFVCREFEVLGRAFPVHTALDSTHSASRGQFGMAPNAAPSNRPKALVLVGGYGTRLRPLTLTVPKPIIDFGEQGFAARCWVASGIDGALCRTERSQEHGALCTMSCVNNVSYLFGVQRTSL